MTIPHSSYRLGHSNDCRSLLRCFCATDTHEVIVLFSSSDEASSGLHRSSRRKLRKKAQLKPGHHPPLPSSGDARGDTEVRRTRMSSSKSETSQEIQESKTKVEQPKQLRRPPQLKQAKVAPTTATGASTRSSRKVRGETQQIKEAMSFYELQAQEQMMARFQAQNRKKAPDKQKEPSSTSVAAGQAARKSGRLKWKNGVTASQAKKRAAQQSHAKKCQKPVFLERIDDEQYDSVYDKEEEREQAERVFFTETSVRREKRLRKQKWETRSGVTWVSESGRKSKDKVSVSRKSGDDHHKSSRKQQGVRNMDFVTRPKQQQTTAGRKQKQQAFSITRQSDSSQADKQESEQESVQESDELSGKESEDDEAEVSTLPRYWRQEKVPSQPKLKSKVIFDLSTAVGPTKRSYKNTASALPPRGFCASEASEHIVLDDTSEAGSVTEISSWELQEQEKMFSRLHAQKKNVSSDVSSTDQKKRHYAYGPTGADRTSGSSCRARMGGYQKKTHSIPSSSSSFSPPRPRNGFPASGAKFAADVESTVPPVEIPTTPVVHSTAWRRLIIGKAPPNVIVGTSASPYAYGFDRPLWTYDTTGVLEEECKFRAVGLGTATTEVNTENQVSKQLATIPPSQSEVNVQVRYLVSQELLRIQKYHVQRVRHTLKSMRQQLAEYFRNLQELRSERCRRLRWLEIASKYSRDKPPFEYVVHPETVIYLPNDITAICQSFTMISIRKNAFVEDDPILRYVPYLGDGQEMVIDNDLYSGTTMSKERQIAVFGEGKELNVIKPSARDDEILEYVLRVIIEKCGTSEHVFRALEEAGFSQPRIDYLGMKEQARATKVTATRMAKVKELVAAQQKSFRDEQSGNTVAGKNVYKALYNLAQHQWFLQNTSEHQSLGVRLQPPLSVFESNYANAPEALGIRDRAAYEGLVEWHRDLFCRRCYSYDCSEHGIQNPQRRARADPVYPMVIALDVLLAGQETMSRESLVADECSPKDTTLSVESEEAIVLTGSDSSSSLDDEAQNNTNQPILVDQPSSDPAALNRRSRRTQTRISSLASKSLQSQEKMLEIQRLAKLERQRKRREKFSRAPDNSEYLDDSYLPAVTATQQMLLSETQPCGPFCKLSAGDIGQSDSCEPMRRIDAVLVRKLAATLGPNACMLSAMVRSPWCTCAQIFNFLTEEKKRSDSGDYSGNENNLLMATQRQQKGRHSAVAGLNRSLSKRVREHCSFDHEKKLSYEPCNHEGVCDGTCQCTQRGHSCNKTCSCSRDCPNRFQGCKCSAGKCYTLACPCYTAGRECDPDYCFHCGASDAAVMAFHPTLSSQSCYDLHICCNVNMLRNSTQKKIGVAFSATHGWGAFALEPIRRDEFVLEYTGELITDEEAERRGAMYDRKFVSYLFGVNSEYVVDAARKGNKAKFANHRTKKKANMNVKVIVSNGEHRIGLFAREAIEVGAELFFDYGYTHDSAPIWSHHGRSMSEQFVYDIIGDENELDNALHSSW
uniref:Uncharacterized protein n=1 Tax=Hyaloperonospora arabidopsidis (strain Emoy2) TaxID=559515 RepID=M4BTP2_HYAAE